MNSAAREGARAHLVVMGVIWATHIASPIPSESGPHNSGDAHTDQGCDLASRRMP